MKEIKIYPPGTKARTVSGGIEGFVTGVKICDAKGYVIYEFAFFNNDGYRQVWVDEYELDFYIDVKKTNIGFK